METSDIFCTSLSCKAWEQAMLNQGLEDLGWEKEWEMYASMPDTITSIIHSAHKDGFLTQKRYSLQGKSA